MTNSFLFIKNTKLQIAKICTIRPLPLYSQRRQIIYEISIVIMLMFIVNLSAKMFHNWKPRNWTQTRTDLNFKVSKRIWLTNYWFMNDLLSCLFFTIHKIDCFATVVGNFFFLVDHSRDYYYFETGRNLQWNGHFTKLDWKKLFHKNFFFAN